MFRLLLFLLCGANLGFSQILIRGHVVDHTSKLPIAFTNIGIEKTAIGTLSNEDGSFSIRIPEQLIKDTLIFSAIGYTISKKQIQALTNSDFIIELQEQTIQLEEVTITQKKEKNKTFELGNKSVGGGTLETDTLYTGAVMALLIENENSVQKDLHFPIYLEKASLRIFRNNLPSFRIRLRIYSIDKASKQPSEDLLRKSIVLESSMKNGWLTFDLSELKFVVTEPFFIAFERILTKADRALISRSYQQFIYDHPNKIVIDTIVFEGKKIVRQKLKGGGIDLPGTFIGIASGKSNNFTCYTRKTSFDTWEKVRGIVTATVTLSNQSTTSFLHK